MLFDFERVERGVKLAYKRCGMASYSLEDVLKVFRYYFEAYEMVFGVAHPMININQITRIIEHMPFVFSGEGDSTLDISPEDYCPMIDQHFITEYRNCDYNINHFFSGKIRDMRFYEACYC